MREYLYCKCGHPITVLHNFGGVACRKDGLRFLDTEMEEHFTTRDINKKIDAGVHCFRCPNCTEVIERKTLLELGEL